MKLFNTMSRRKEEFVPLEEGKVRMYVCGPTVYNLIHIGNARPMIIFDTVRRYLEYKGYEVNYVSNFTDVDDKIIKKAIEEGVSAEEISQRYIAECKKDMAGMNVKPATTHPLATQEIDGMIDMIQTLIDKGYAYPVADGTVYFRVKKFKEYGKLSHKNLDDLQSGFRSLQVSGEDQKEDPLDFVLWKPKKGNRSGNLHGATEDRDGILNAPLCPRNTWARRSIFMPVVRTLYSLIMRMRLHRVNAAMEFHLQNTGCTMHS